MNLQSFCLCCVPNNPPFLPRDTIVGEGFSFLQLCLKLAGDFYLFIHIVCFFLISNTKGIIVFINRKITLKLKHWAAAEKNNYLLESFLVVDYWLLPPKLPIFYILLKIYFIDYTITLAAFPPLPPSTQHSHSLHQSLPNSSCPWVIHVPYFSDDKMHFSLPNLRGKWVCVL